jgi:hypothetical protein
MGHQKSQFIFIESQLRSQRAAIGSPLATIPDGIQFTVDTVPEKNYIEKLFVELMFA